MRASRFLCAAASALAVVLAVSPALAAKQARIRPVSGPIQVEGVPDTLNCIGIGPNTVPNETVDLFEPQYGPDRYFVRLDTGSECTNCTTTRVFPRFINVILNFRCTCQQQMFFRFVRGKSVGGTYRPDLSQPLMDFYLNYGLFNVAPLPCLSENVAMKQFVLELPSYLTDTLSCLPRDAFLEAHVVNFAQGCDVEDLLVEWTFDTLQTCQPNTFWNYYADEVGNHEDDMCQQSLETPIAMWLDGQCCAVVPTRKTTWGTVRRTYHRTD
jgi:hypothetical protein